MLVQRRHSVLDRPVISSTSGSSNPAHGIPCPRTHLQPLPPHVPNWSLGCHLAPPWPLGPLPVLVPTWHTIHSTTPSDKMSSCRMGSPNTYHSELARWRRIGLMTSLFPG